MIDQREIAAEPPARTPAPPLSGPAERPRGAARTLGRSLAFRNVSALYVFAVILVVFSLWVPDTFLAWTTWKTLLDNQAVAAMTAIALVLPLAAGVFDLAVGLEVGLGSMLAAWLLVDQGVPVGAAIPLAVLAGALVGTVNGLLVVKARIDSFIATLGVSSILAALISWISGGEQILGVPASFARVGTGELLGVTYPVWFLLVVALTLWYVLERTPVGRRVYATGGNLDAARLAGVRTPLVIVGCLAACGAVAAFGGVLVTSRLANGDPTIGPGYMLPAFTAAFLGSTQFRGGRFNVWGTVVAVYVLAAGVKGLQLAGAPVWIPDLFNGTALLIAVAMAKHQGSAGRASAIRRLLRLDRGVSSAAAAKGAS